jgi:hypothetical protein
MTLVRAVFFMVILFSCGVRRDKIVMKELSEQNIPSHTFNIPYGQLRDTLPSLFTIDKQYRNKNLERFFFYYSSEDRKNENKHLINFSAETSSEPIFSSDYFKEPNTKDDIYLTAMGAYWQSQIYYVKANPLHYTTAFVCKLKRIDKQTTQLTVQAEDPVVANGTNGLGPHGYIANVQKVAPTSVEEYALLLFIAEQLNEKGLQPIIVP